jgi:protein phosphatase
MQPVASISAALRTDTGLVRGHNEDFVAAFEPATPEDQARHGWLYIVADGVGGADAGEVASQFAAERAIHHYLGSDGGLPVAERLLESMQAANTDLRSLAADREVQRRMATTMVAVAINGDRATIGNVGDSRAYLWRLGTIQQVTKDQSLVARLVEEGAITPDEAATHPHKNIILTSIGSEKRPPIDLYERELQPGDLLLLCSDGLTRHASDREIAVTLGQMEPEEAADSLVRLARGRGGEDNISVVVVRFGPQAADFTMPVDSRAPAVAAPAVGVPVAAPAAHQPSLWPLTLVLAAIMVALIIFVWYAIQTATAV